MSQRRPSNNYPPRQGARPAPARRPQGSYPRGGAGARRQPPRKKSNMPLLLLVILLALAAIVFAIVKLIPGGNDPQVTSTPAPAFIDAGNTADTGDTSDTGDTADTGDIGALLESEDSAIAGLTRDQQVDVTDLYITQGLPSEWLNVLLLGGDARSLKESCRTDAIMICSINTKTGEIKLTSIMRDLAVAFDNIGENNGTYRINSAYYFGGPKLAVQTVNRLLHMNIQHYAFVNFYGFQQIAHAMGGITIDISEAEMEEINTWAVQQYKLGEKYGIDETALESDNVFLETFGPDTHLNGRQTLAYCRIRHIDSDTSRAERQRRVLVALLDKAKTLTLYDTMSLATTASEYIDTNLDLTYIMQIAQLVIQNGMSNVEQLRLPLNKTYTEETRNDKAMLYDCDWQANADELYEFIYQ